jgi:hypothetical protein
MMDDMLVESDPKKLAATKQRTSSRSQRLRACAPNDEAKLERRTVATVDVGQQAGGTSAVEVALHPCSRR